MIQKIINFLNRNLKSKKLHKQFQEIQKWQSEMYDYKTRQDFLKIH